ncbi:HAD family hydrolase [Actinokineospora bangkokensis]|uniref:HAD family hydrolase n=1 Tax=Actinokineospora bangkokensis TaxID=1193682 RepID=A0A1Q9LIL5_9PSEU|nr:HAD family hydrolase [Actinokineospora bangkokensis]OLR91891.1 hypothetical protein BJP25_23970 [Actinokineospora bangkokensis]
MRPFAVFDLDDTLVDSTAAADRWLVQLVDSRGLGPDALEFLRAEAASPATPQVSFTNIITKFGFTESWRDLRDAFAEGVPRLARPLDGVLSGLRDLRERGWRQALLTNGTAVDQLPKLGGGLLDLFDVVCYAEDEVAPKPDPAVFRLVAERAGADLDGAWMVGDSLENDVAGGAAVGMRTLWISHGARVPEVGPRPDVVVATPAEAFAVLAAGAGRGGHEQGH